jgi:hypothetical protein
MHYSTLMPRRWCAQRSAGGACSRPHAHAHDRAVLVVRTLLRLLPRGGRSSPPRLQPSKLPRTRPRPRPRHAPRDHPARSRTPPAPAACSFLCARRAALRCPPSPAVRAHRDATERPSAGHVRYDAECFLRRVVRVPCECDTTEPSLGLVTSHKCLLVRFRAHWSQKIQRSLRATFAAPFPIPNKKNSDTGDTPKKPLQQPPYPLPSYSPWTKTPSPSPL